MGSLAMLVMTNVTKHPAREERAHIEGEVWLKRCVQLSAHNMGGVELAALGVLTLAPAHHMQKWVALECPI